jgi:hypothetical protein
VPSKLVEIELKRSMCRITNVHGYTYVCIFHGVRLTVGKRSSRARHCQAEYYFFTNSLCPDTGVHNFILITIVLEYFISNEILIVVMVSGVQA